MNKKPKRTLIPLNNMVLAAKAATDADIRRKIFSEIIAEHGGLGAMIYREFSHIIEPYEAKSYMFEALEDLMTTWDPALRKASTELRYRVMCRIRKWQQGHVYVGGVRIPPSQLKRLSSCEIDEVTEQKLYEMYEELECDSKALEEEYDWTAIKRQTGCC